MNQGSRNPIYGSPMDTDEVAMSMNHGPLDSGGREGPSERGGRGGPGGRDGRGGRGGRGGAGFRGRRGYSARGRRGSASRGRGGAGRGRGAFEAATAARGGGGGSGSGGGGGGGSGGGGPSSNRGRGRPSSSRGSASSSFGGPLPNRGRVRGRGGPSNGGRPGSSFNSGRRGDYDPQLPKRQGPYGVYEFPNYRGEVAYFKKFLTPDEADQVFTDINKSNSFQRTCTQYRGRDVLQPRDTAYFGTNNDNRLTGWFDDPPASTTINSLREYVEDFCGLPKDFFNVVLANRYNHGRDSISWHSDDEKSLGDTPVIASLSLGATRRFLVRPKRNNLENDPQIYEYELTHGSLLVMSGPMQQFYQHAVPKVSTRECNEIRINLTFRHDLMITRFALLRSQRNMGHKWYFMSVMRGHGRQSAAVGTVVLRRMRRLLQCSTTSHSRRIPRLSPLHPSPCSRVIIVLLSQYMHVEAYTEAAGGSLIQDRRGAAQRCLILLAPMQGCKHVFLVFFLLVWLEV
eukprot:IDg8119t1